MLLLGACGDGDAASSRSASSGSTSGLRIVDLADNVFDLAQLGIAPVGTIYGADYLRPALAPLVHDATVRDKVLDATLVTGDGFKPDTEKIASLRPDLVVTTAGFVQYYAAKLENVRKVAKVIVLPDGTWQERPRALGREIGRADDGDARVRKVEERIRDLGGAVERAGLRGRTVSLLRLFPPAQVYAFVPPSLASTIVAGAGLVQPPVQRSTKPDAQLPGYAAQAPFSEENLGPHDGDVLLLSEASDGDLETFTSGKVAKTLGAVRAGRTGAVPYFLWALNSAAGAAQVVEDLERLVVERSSASARPAPSAS